MITAPYSGIPEPIASMMQSLITDDDTYHKGHARRTARTVVTILDQSPTGTLLELGTSHIIPLLLHEFAPSLAVTVTDFDLELPSTGVKDIALGKSTPYQVPCYRVDLETQPLPADDESFDYVVCCEVLEHMERDPMFMLSEINRVLKPGGTLILTTPNVVSTRGITKMLHGIEPYFYMQYHTSGNLYRHNYEYSVHSLMNVVRAAGFDGTIWTENTFEDPTVKDIERLKTAGYNLTHTGDNIFTVAKKIGPVLDRYPAGIYVTD